MSKKVFLREATGLVREWAWYDGLMFSMFAMAVGFFSVLVINANAASFPGANPALGVILATVCFIPEAIVYSFLAASMPRAGGEYVFQSRIIHPVLAYVGVGMFLLGNMWFGPFAGSTFVQTAVAPFLTVLAYTTGNNWYVSAANSFGTAEAAVIVTLILFAWEWVLSVAGMRIYGMAQRIGFVIAMITTVALMGLFLTTSHDTFVRNFNQLAMTMSNQTNAYQNVINTAQKSGFTTDFSFSWSQTLYSVAAWSSIIGFMGYYTAMSGEIKRASSVKNQIGIGVLGLVAVGLFLAILTGLADNMVGRQFSSSASYLFNSGNFSLPVAPYLGLYAVVAAPLTATAVIVFLFVSSWGLLTLANGFPYNSRVSMAMAFDRVLPAKMAEVNDRTHAPIINITVWLIVDCIFVGLYYVFPSLSNLFLLTSLLASVMFILSAVCGILFPFKKSMKATYEASPIAKYKVGGVPIVSIAGVLGVIVWVFVDYLLLTVPSLGIAGANITISLTFLVVLAVAFVGLYAAFYYYNKSKGIDISKAFAELPPE